MVSVGVVAAAGIGSRMWPASKVVPKELFPLGRLPAIGHVIIEMVHAGVSDILVVAGAHNADLLSALFDARIHPPPRALDDEIARDFQDSISAAKVQVVTQTGGPGNGRAVCMACERFGLTPLIFAYGDDVVIGENMTHSLIGAYSASATRSIIAAQEAPVSRCHEFGIIEVERRGNIDFVTKFHEKPRPGVTNSNLASFGRYLVDPTLLRTVVEMGSSNEEIWFVNALQAHVERNEVAVVRTSAGKWYTVGDSLSYSQAEPYPGLRNGAIAGV